MRKMSQDGGDSTSITSGFENEYKKISMGIMKSTRTSLKKRVHSLSHDSDDAVIEPLLQKEKEKDKVDIAAQSAKYLLSKTKTEQVDKGKEKLELKTNEAGSKVSPLITTGSIDQPDTAANSVRETLPKSTVAAGHSYTSTFANYSNGSISSAPPPRTQILVDIDGHKLNGHSASPLIFTTAKIHADGKTKQMERVHVTVGPISSTTEVNKIQNVVNSGKVQNTPITQDSDAKNSCVIKAVTNDVKVSYQPTKTPDVIASAIKPTVVIKGSTISTKMGGESNATGLSTSTNREKLSKLEPYLEKKESKEENSKKVDETVTTPETKNIHTVTAVVKTSKDVKDSSQQINDSIGKSINSKDTTIKIEPFVIDKKLDGLGCLVKDDKLLSKSGNTITSTKGAIDKKHITKVESQIAKDANKHITKITHTSNVTDDKKVPKETLPSTSTNKGLNKVEVIKQLNPQKKSTLDEPSEIEAKVKPKSDSALPTPTTAASVVKGIPKAETVKQKKEVDSNKTINPIKTGSVTVKDIKDNTKTPKSSETSSIPIKTIKTINVVTKTTADKPMTVAKQSSSTSSSSTASTIILKQSSSTAATVHTATSQPTSTAKLTPKSPTSPIVSTTTIDAVSTAKVGAKATEQKSKDLNKTGKPSKA